MSIHGVYRPLICILKQKNFEMNAQKPEDQTLNCSRIKRHAHC